MCITPVPEALIEDLESPENPAPVICDPKPQTINRIKTFKTRIKHGRH
jgi:hypothetical protein